jgi:hypothetical protein
VTQTDPIIVTQTGSLAVVGTDQSSNEGVLASPETAAMIVEYLAENMTGLHRITGRWVQIRAKVVDGHIAVDLQRVRFDADDCAVRMMLSPTVPVSIPPVEPAA